MGTASSIKPSFGSYSRVYETVPDVGCRKSQFQALQLRESEVGLLYEAFLNSDTGHIGIVNTAQLTSFLKTEKNDLVCRILSSFKMGLKFEGSVFEIWNMCTLEDSNLASFVFNLYDVNSAGVLGPDVAKLMLEELYGESFLKEKSRTSKDVLKQLFGSENITEMKKESFEDFTRRQSRTLSKAVAFRKSLRSGFVYKSFWTTQAKRRKIMDKPLLAKIQNMRLDIVAGRIEETRVKKADSLTFIPNFDKEIDDAAQSTIVTAESSIRSLLNESAKNGQPSGNLNLDKTNIPDENLFNNFEAGRKSSLDSDLTISFRENECFFEVPESDQMNNSFRNDTSPKRNETSLIRNDTPPKRTETSLKGSDTSPKRNEASPKGNDTSPKRIETPPKRNNAKAAHRRPSRESDRKAELLNDDDIAPPKKERSCRPRRSTPQPEAPLTPFFNSIFLLFSNDVPPNGGRSVESSSRYADTGKRPMVVEELEGCAVSSRKSENGGSSPSKRRPRVRGNRLSVSFDTNTHIIHDPRFYLNLVAN